MEYDTDHWKEEEADESTTNGVTLHDKIDGAYNGMRAERDRLLSLAVEEKVLIIHYGSLTERKELVSMCKKNGIHVMGDGDDDAVEKSKSIYFGFTRADVAEKYILELQGKPLYFDRIYVIMDHIGADKIAESLKKTWGFDGGFANLNVSIYMKQPIAGRDARYIDVGEWFREAAIKSYRGNFRIGTEWDTTTHPFDIINFMLCFTPHNVWEAHIMSRSEDMKSLMESSNHFMLGSR